MKVLKLGIVVVAAIALSGCTVAVPLAASAVSEVAVGNAVDSTYAYDAKVRRMSCSQLRVELAKLNKDILRIANPLGHWSTRRTLVRNVARDKGCRL